MGSGHGEERTWNMERMSVTLDVSKLSGWLNADALRNMEFMVVTLEVSTLSGWLNPDAACRESKGGHTMQGEGVARERREAAGDRGARSAQGRGLNYRLGAGHGEGRTLNMAYIVVTLDVSKVSGWLNAYADCRVAQRHMEGDTGGLRGARARGGAMAVLAACTEEPT